MAFVRVVESERLAYDYEIVSAVSQARSALAERHFDLVISDYSLGDGTALDILDAAEDIPVLVVTGAGNEEIAVKAWKAGAYDYLVKDDDRSYLKVLPIAVENALRHKRTEDELRLLSGAIMSTNDSVFITDMDDKIVFVNTAFCRTYGYTEQDILGRQSSVLWIGKDQCASTRSVFRMQTAEGGWQVGFYHKRKDGSVFPVSLSRSIVKDGRGVQVAIVATVWDITERLLVEDQLRKANALLTQQNRQLADQAMSAAQAISDLLTPYRGQQSVASADESLDQAWQIAEDFLLLSRIISGRIELNPVELDLSTLVQETVTTLSPDAQRKNVSLDVTVPEANPIIVLADREKFSHAVGRSIAAVLSWAQPGGQIQTWMNTNAGTAEILISTATSDMSPAGRTDLTDCQHDQLAAMALAASQEIMAVLGGQLQADTSDQHNRSIRLSLPTLHEPHARAGEPAGLSQRA